MSVNFRAHWLAGAEKDRLVSLIISTIGREESPIMEMTAETFVCGIKAGELAVHGEGHITSADGNLRIVPERKLQLA